MPDKRTNEEWLRDLRAGGASQESALADLRDLLLRASLYFFSRNLEDFQGLGRSEILQRAEDCAQDALIAVLDHLPEFRGDSHFTTWAYKFAINLSMVAARRERWKAVSFDALTAAGTSHLFAWMIQDKSDGSGPEQSSMQAEIREIVQDVIAHDLTERQQQVLVMMLVHEIPLDEVVRHLGTNRNAVYKMLHDARLKIKTSLKERGFEIGEMLDLFGTSR
jgi:RNA polymerase sigma-70 factor (ECF subfamily)